MKAAGAKVVIVETYSSRKSAEFVANQVDGAAVVLCQNVLAAPGVDSYEELLQHNVDTLVAALEALAADSGDTGKH